MLRELAPVFTRLHRALDIGSTVAAFIGAFYIRKDLLPSPFGGRYLFLNWDSAHHFP